MIRKHWSRGKRLPNVPNGKKLQTILEMWVKIAWYASRYFTNSSILADTSFLSLGSELMRYVYYLRAEKKKHDQRLEKNHDQHIPVVHIASGDQFWERTEFWEDHSYHLDSVSSSKIEKRGNFIGVLYSPDETFSNWQRFIATVKNVPFL